MLGMGLLFTVGCGDSSDAENAAEKSKVQQAVAPELAAKIWQVRMADAEVRSPFEQQQGWAKLFSRELDVALQALAGREDGAPGLARTHAEFAGFYRQAALLGANSTLEVYGADRQAVDPVEVDFLLATSSAITGECDAAKKALDSVTPDTIASLQKHGAQDRFSAISDWISKGCSMPLDLEPTAAVWGFGDVELGGTPDVGDLPHYLFSEQTEEAREVKAGDLMSILVLAQWHHRAATDAATKAGLQPEVAGQLIALWGLEGESFPAPSSLEVNDAWLFGGFILASEDLAFLGEARNEGVASVEKWKDQSPLAAAVAPSIQDGAVVPELMLDQAAFLGQQVESAMVEVAGREEAFHQGFSDLARTAAIRAGMVVADANGQFRDAGILRVNAKDLSNGPASDPVFFMSVAAWDAGNRNPLRAQDLVHSLVDRFPALAAARYSLDAMQVRLSRNAAPATPVH